MWGGVSGIRGVRLSWERQNLVTRLVLASICCSPCYQRTTPRARSDMLRLAVLVLAGLARGAVLHDDPAGRQDLAPHTVLRDILSQPFPPAALLNNGNYSRHCARHARLYLSQLSKYIPWALNMFDASTKMPSGVITGNIANLGHYDQCVKIAVEDEVTFTGQLCTASVQFNLHNTSLTNLSDPTPDVLGLLSGVARAADQKDLSGLATVAYRWSFCVPSTCSAEDVQSMLDESLSPLSIPGRLHVAVDVPTSSCLTTLSALHQFATLDYYFLSIMAIFALLLISGTTYDVYLSTKESSKTPQTRLQLAVRAFSVLTNCRALLRTDISGDTITCLNGIRFLSICWIIFGHTYYQTSISPLINALEVSRFRNRWEMMVVMNGTVSTDTFFLLSGALLCYSFMKDRSKGLGFNLVKFYLHRYIRLTPPYAAVVFFYATMLYHVGSGPLWHSTMAVERDNCLDSWWTNLLYLNNYVNVANTCVSQSWYLTVDMQLFWVTPLCLYPLWRWRRLGLAVLVVFVVVSMAVPLAVTAYHHLTGAMLYTTGSSVADVFVKVYLPSYTRAGPYFVGIALGYLLYVTRGKEVDIPKWVVCAAWSLSLCTMAGVVFGVLGMYQEQHLYDVVEASIYAGLHRTVWALCVSWPIFACVAGYAGPVNTFLSWSLWHPLSRLSYCAYLCHFVFLLVNTGLTRTPGFTSGYNVLREMLGIMPLVLLTSAAMSLTFEMPFCTLDRIFLAQKATPSNVQSPNHRRLEASVETLSSSKTS